MSMRSGSWALCIACGIVGCSKSSTQETPDASTFVVASATASASSAPPKVNAAPEINPRAETEQETEDRRRYRTAMTNGRLATMQHKYTVAIGAFDGALAAKRNDPRALAEKSYARILSGTELEDARTDLARAASSASDPKLLSQIWFNLGLVEDQLHAPDNAQIDYWMADRASPSPAARSKLKGKKLCPIRVDHAFTAAFPEKQRVQASTWLELWKELAANGSDESNPPKNEDEAAQALAHEPASAVTFPVLVMTPSVGGPNAELVVNKTKAGLVAVAIGANVGGRCPGRFSFSIVKTQGDLVHINGVEVPEGGYSYMCIHQDAGADPALEACNDAELASDLTVVQSYCAGGSATDRDLVVDLQAGRVLVAVERPESQTGQSAMIKATLGNKGLSLSGLDCNGMTIPLTSPMDAGTPR